MIKVLWGLLISTLMVSAQYIPKFDVQGHRGARGLKPENTIPAFLAALDLGVTTVEMDVVITKDKQVILSHEPWFSAAICLDTAGNTFTEKEEKKYTIYSRTYAEIQQFDCGSKGNPKFPSQERMSITKPLLSQVIIAVENHIKNHTQYEVDYNIEIKSTAEGDKKLHPSVEEFSDLVYQQLDEYLPMDRIVIQSFDFRVLRYWHKKYPGVRLAALIENARSMDANLKELGFIPSIYSPDFKLLSKEKVNYLHTKTFTLSDKTKAKLRVIPWTVNEESDMLALKGMGVDGFITDYPDRAKKYKMTLNIHPR